MSDPESLVERRCSKPGCGALAKIGSPCTDWDCPQQTVSASDYAALRSRCAELEAERDEARQTAKDNDDALERWRNNFDALLAARDEAVAALEPFAKLADQIDAWGHGDDSTCDHRLKARDIRRARSLTQAAGKEKG